MNNSNEAPVSGVGDGCHRSLVGALREGPVILRVIVGIVILAFGGLVTSPAVAAVRQEASTIQWHHPDDSAAKLSAALHGLHTMLGQIPSSVAIPQALTRSVVGASATQNNSFSNARSELRSYRDQLAGLNQNALARFASVKEHLQQHHLPQVILDRQAKALATYKVRMAALMADLNAAEAAPDAAAFRTHALQAKAQLDQQLFKPAHEKFDPKHLPFSVAKPKHIKPRLNKRAYELNPVVKPKTSQVALNGMNGWHVGMGSGDAAPAGVPANPADPSYLAPTDDVQITPAIQALAKQLNNNPVEIYNWVHNNIEYIPTYGSIQGSDMTLQTLRGNDFDTASLLIALLRASNIPARYVYGTIQVPIAQVENWVGGVTDPNAALNLLGQGGVPVTGLAQGGVIQYAQMEHVWVDAWVDFIPSRGAKAGPGNTWIPMDASFKQYTYTQGMNLQQAVPFDASAVVQQIAQTATVNTTEGWVSNLNTSYIQQQATAYQQQAATFLGNLQTTQPDTTVGDLAGTKAIVPRDADTLAASLPYEVAAVGQRMTSLPDDLVWEFTYQLTDDLGNPVLTYTIPTAELDGKLLAVSFAPSTQADAQVIANLLSTVPAGGTLDPSQLPKSLPGYLINLTPQITLGNQIVASGGSYTMGTDITTQEGYWSPQSGWQTVNSDVVAGEYHAVGLDLQGISDTQIQSLVTALQSTQSTVQSGSIAGLTAQDVVGNILQSGVLSYFYLNNNQDWLTQQLSGVVKYPLPSFGTFKLIAQTTYNFGIPQSVSFPGVNMNIVYYHSMGVAKDNNPQEAVQYFSAIGPRLSAYEHQIPEELFSTTSQPVQGISAVRALSLAAAQGQRIYTITSANLATALPELTVGDAVEQDIQDAVNAGMIVTVSQSPVTYAGWTGTGYIIKDPATGTGAYKISGNANGGTSILLTMGILIGVAALIFTAVFLEVITGGLAILAIAAILYANIDFDNRVGAIADEDAPPDKKLSQLNQAEFAAVLSAVLAGSGLIEFEYIEADVEALRILTELFSIAVSSIFLP